MATAGVTTGVVAQYCLFEREGGGGGDMGSVQVRTGVVAQYCLFERGGGGTWGLFRLQQV